MKKYMIGFLIFIGCAQILCADDDSGLFDYVASRDEVAVLSMVQEDFDAFNDLGLQINKFDHTVRDEQGRVCTIKVVRENGCTVGAIFYTSFVQCGSNDCEVKFLVVDELHQNKGYGSFMIKSIFNQMSELTGDGSSMFGPLIDISRCRAFDEGFSNFDLLELAPLDESIFDRLQYIEYSNLDMVFVQACRDLDIEKIRESIAEGVNINQLFMFEDIPDHRFVMVADLQSPLCFAIENNNCELAEILINAGANLVDICYESTPLRIAMEQRNINMMLLLIEAGCDVDELDSYDNSLLYSATYYLKDIEIAKILIDADADIYVQSPYGRSLLDCAMAGYNPEFVLMLFQAGYDVNYKGDYGYTPLHKAVYNICDIVIFEALLAAGADITVTDYEGFTALDLLEQMLDEKSSKLFSSYRLRSEIDQLEKIKAILLQAQNQ